MQVQTLEVDSGNLRERFSLIGSIISESFGASWSAEPIGEKHRPARLGWARADGVAVSRAQMTPLRLVNKCADPADARKYYIYTADQKSTLNLENRDQIRLHPNEIIIIGSDAPGEWVMTENYETSCLILEKEVFETYLPNYAAVIGKRLNFSLGIQELLRGMIDSAWEISCAGLFEEAGPKLARSFLELLSVASLSQLPTARQDRSLAKALETRRAQIKTHIKRNFRDPDLSACTIATAFGLSPRYIQLAFAPENITPSEYIRKIRLETCAQILSDAREFAKSITDIAFDCGFNSSSHFSTQFRRHFGVSPRYFRDEAHNFRRRH